MVSVRLRMWGANSWRITFAQSASNVEECQYDTYVHGYIDSKAKCRPPKKFTSKGTFGKVFISVYRREKM